ncbi:MAG: branched-chain amino acid ABC transporter permease [Nitrososphaerota archaeon]|nr:branched-chain amino acid ABC transporter permease [Nitrososphaerota archaeon]
MSLHDVFGKISFKTPSFGIIVASIVGLVLIPIISNNAFYQGVFITVSIYGVLAMSWDVLSGLTGYLNFGLAFSFGVGGYVAALVSTRVGWPPYIGILIGGIGSVFFGLLIGIPSLRLRGHFFILVTLLVPLAAAALLDYVFVQDGSIFGVNDIINNSQYVYSAAVAVFAATGIILYIIANSNIGLIFRSIRENEIAAEASGVRTGRYKIFAFSISSFFAGMAGAVYVYSNGVASPTNFGILLSALPVFMAALGGVGTIAGPVIGAFILEGSIDLLRINYIQDIRLLLASILLFAILLYAPGGIWGTIRRRFKLK